MNDSEKVRLRYHRLERYVWVLAMVWTVVVATSLVWNMIQIKQNILEAARIQARTAFNKDVMYRRWNTGHGGVYVPVTEVTKPNPYLSDMPERDMTTPLGKPLTLINPAYMTRQVHELADEENAVYGHITSLNPIRPENAPDPWETGALQAFGRGETETSSVKKMEGEKFMRLMRPLITEKGCLKCHAMQGYQEGDIMGGISASIPMEPLWASARMQVLTLAAGHIMLWLMGLGGIVLGTQRLRWSERERNRTEEAIRQSERKYRILIENLKDMVFTIDPGGGLDFVSQSSKEILGYKREEGINKNVIDFIPVEDRQRVIETIQRGMKGEKIINFQTPAITKSGDRIILEVTVSRIWEKGIAVGALVIARDVTERKKAEEMLRMQSEIVANIAEGVYLIRMEDRTIVYANPRLEKMFGYDPGEMIGRNVSIVNANAPTPERSQEETRDEIMEVLEKTGEWHGEVNNIKKDGTPFWCYANVSVFDHHEHGKILVSVHQDITERKRTEEELRTYREHLEEMVEKRTYELRELNEQLQQDIAERKRAEEALRESEEKYRGLFENSTDFVFTLDLKGNFINVNKAAENLTGYTKEELTRMHFRDYTSKDDHEKIFQIFNGLFMEGKSLKDYPLEVIVKGGNKKYFETNASLIKKGNEIVGFQGSSRDITERVKTEEAMRATEQRFRELTNSISDVFFAMDENLKYTYWNKASEELTGISAEEALGKSLHDLFPDIRGTKAEELYLETLRTRQARTGINRYESQGQEYIFELTAYPSGKGLAVLARDVTEHKQAEKAIRESEERYRSLFEESRDGVYISTSQGEFVEVNQTVVNLFGYSKEEMIGMDVHRIYVDSSDRESFLQEIEKKGSVRDYEIKLKNKEGIEIDCQITSTLRRADDGTILGNQGIVRDITERKRAEEELRKRGHDLGERVKELRCLYGISDLEKRSISLSEIFQGVVEFIPPGWQYPEDTCAKIIFEDQMFFSENFRETAWSQAVDIKLEGDNIGTLQVYYLEEKPELDKGPFLKEEISLLNAIAESLGNTIARKRTEKALRNEKAKLEMIISELLVGVSVYDESGQCIMANDAVAKLVGAGAKEDIMAQNYNTVESWKKSGLLDKAKKAMNENSVQREPELKINTTFGHDVVLDCYFIPVLMGDEKYMMLTTYNIKERLEAEEDLRIKDSAIASSNSAIALSDLEGNLNYVNPFFVKLWGYDDEEEILGKPIMSFWQLEEKAVEVIKELPGLGNWMGELTAKRKNGSFFQAQLSASMVKDKTGKPVCMMASFIDITERKRAEEALRNTASEWRKTFDTIPDMIMLLDPQHKITRLNLAAARFLGLSYHEIQGQHCYQLVHGLDAPPEFCPHKQALDEGKGHSVEFCDNLDRNFHIMINPVFDESGNLTGSVHVMRDITERKKMETRALQSEKLASVGQLAAGVAHEINNPTAFVMTNLNQLAEYISKIIALLGNTRSLIRDTGDEPLIQRFKSLEKESDMDYIESDQEDLISESLDGLIRIRNIVADLRIFSYMGEEEIEEININDVVNSAINMAQSEIKYRGRVEKSLGEVPGAFGIRGRLAQVVLNILVNAAHALDENEAENNRVIVTTGTQDNRIFVRIRDTGSGIPSQTLARIFDPFYTTKPAGVGTGLGLTICQDILNKHGGEITAESQMGKGSTFTMWLPMDTGLELSAAPRQETSSRDSIFQGAKVLVVDDEKAILNSLKRLLKGHYQVILAVSAREALEAMEEDSDFDLILCDLVMPGMNGQALYTEAIRRWPYLEPRFLFFTGGAFTPRLKEFSNKMKSRTLQKPIQADEIIAIINTNLGNTNQEKNSLILEKMVAKEGRHEE